MNDQNAMVAVCDILGFKALKRAQIARELLTGPLGYLHRVLHHSVRHEDFPRQPARLDEILSQGRVGVSWYADTFLLYSLADTDLAIRNVLEAAGWMLFETILSPSPSPKLRIGVAYGDFPADARNHLFLGKALLEAHCLEKAQTWSGGVLTKSAAARVPARESSGPRFQWWLTEYRPPLKSAEDLPETSNLCLNWTQGIHEPVTRRWSPSSPCPPPNTPKDHVLYWENTWKFHDAVCDESRCQARRAIRPEKEDPML